MSERTAAFEGVRTVLLCSHLLPLVLCLRPVWGLLMLLPAPSAAQVTFGTSDSALLDAHVKLLLRQVKSQCVTLWSGSGTGYSCLNSITSGTCVTFGYTGPPFNLRVLHGPTPAYI